MFRTRNSESIWAKKRPTGKPLHQTLGPTPGQLTSMMGGPWRMTEMCSPGWPAGQGLHWFADCTQVQYGTFPSGASPSSGCHSYLPGKPKQDLNNQEWQQGILSTGSSHVFTLREARRLGGGKTQELILKTTLFYPPGPFFYLGTQFSPTAIKTKYNQVKLEPAIHYFSNEQSFLHLWESLHDRLVLKSKFWASFLRFQNLLL